MTAKKAKPGRRTREKKRAVVKGKREREIWMSLGKKKMSWRDRWGSEKGSEGLISRTTKTNRRTWRIQKSSASRKKKLDTNQGDESPPSTARKSGTSATTNLIEPLSRLGALAGGPIEPP